VRDVFNDLRAMGFKRVEIVVLDKGAAEQSLAYAACAYILGDYMNKYWDRPDTGKGWWANPETKVMSWETSGIRLARLRAEPPAVKTADLALPLRLERMRPSELREAVRRGIPCFVPAGVIENHGSHNPVGVDAIEVQDPLVDAAKLWPVVVAPTIWYGGTSYAVTGPELGTMNISGDAYLSYTLGITEGLVAMGFRHLTYVHVHQAGGAQDTSIALSIQEFRRHLGGQKSPRNIAIVDHMGNPGGNCDHAGKHETSWMMYYRKPYVDLSLIRPNDYMFRWYKCGESNTATYEWGKQMAGESIRNYEKVIKERTIPPMTGKRDT